MLLIQKEQMQAFQIHRKEQYVERLVQFLREHFPEAKAEPADEMKQATELMVEKAFFYDLRSERQIARFSVAAWLTGLDFDTQFEEARQILFSGSTPEEKSEMIAEWARKEAGSQERGKI